MTENLERVTAKIFAGNALETQVGQFGSALIGAKLNTTDIATIQGLPAYTTGWSSAVLTNRNYPTLEETNGVMKVLSYQTAYNMQKGVAEWDSLTTYYTGDICKAVGRGQLYSSRSDNNLNHPVTDSTYWVEYTGSQGTIPTTNYIAEMGGQVSYSGNTLNIPAMTMYAPNGRANDNTIISEVVTTEAKTFNLNGAGKYYLFYNANTQNLLLANNFTKHTDVEPTIYLTNDVWYKNDNLMYYVNTVFPNYTLANGATVSDTGIVSNLGSLTLDTNWVIGNTATFNLGFTTGSDITTTQSLFNLPFATATIENGELKIVINSNSYTVSYYPTVYNGAYSLANTKLTYNYTLTDVETIIYSNQEITQGLTVYSNKDLTVEYGVITALTANSITIQQNNEETEEPIDVYSGAYTINTVIALYTYNLGSTPYYTTATLNKNVAVYNDVELNTVFGYVQSVGSGNVLLQNNTTQIGYVQSVGSGNVSSGVIIYSDIDLRTQVETSTGVNATYTGTNEKSNVGTLTFNIEANNPYAGSLTYNGTSYTLTLNNNSTSLISSKLPFNYTTTVSLGGDEAFLGTFNLTQVTISDVWTWNGQNTSVPNWVQNNLIELGTVILGDNTILELEFYEPLELAKYSDIKNLADKNLINTNRITDCILSFVNPVSYTKGANSVTFTLPIGYHVLFANGRTFNNTVNSVDDTVAEILTKEIEVYASNEYVLFLQYLNNTLSLNYALSSNFVEDVTAPTSQSGDVYFWKNPKENKYYTGNLVDGWNQILLVKIATFTTDTTDIISSIDIEQPIVFGKNINSTTGGSGVYKIADPIPTFSDSLEDNEIWLEGAEVSKTAYANLYSVYGDTYGTANDISNFILPDMRNRSLWGSVEGDFGYLEGALPNITGAWHGNEFSENPNLLEGAFYNGRSYGNPPAAGQGSNPIMYFDASRCSSLYKNGITYNQPTSIKVRWKTRYQ